MKKLIFIVALLVGVAQGQTTTITGTIKDLTGANVTSGKVTFTLAPSRDTTISGLARFSPAQVVCLINGSGAVVAQDGVSVCTVTTNTSLQPTGTYYVVALWPGNVKTSQFTFYAVNASYDISTVVPTPTTSPAQNFVDVFSTQTIGGTKTFSGPLSVTGNLIATGGQNSLSAYAIDGIRVVDGVKYPQSVAGIEQALSDAGANQAWVYLPCGNYSDDGLTVIAMTGFSQHILGAGKRCAVINMSIARSGPLFKLATGSSTTSTQNELSGFQISGSGTSASQRIGIQIINGYSPNLHDITMVGIFGATSIGVNIQGVGSGMQLERVEIEADRPVYVQHNPFNVSGYDFDAVHFRDFIFTVNSATESGILIANGVLVTHFTIDGAGNTVNKGCSAISSTQTSDAGANDTQIFISNLNHQQGTGNAATCYSYDLQRSGAAESINGITFLNVASDPSLNGFRLQLTHQLLMLNAQHTRAGGTALNIDNSNVDTRILDSFFQSGSTVTNNAVQTGAGGIDYVTSGQSMRTTVAGSSTYFFDLGKVTFRGGDSANPGSIATTTSNPAASGSLREGNTEHVCWRDAANATDHCVGETQTATVAGCATAASLAATCTTSVTWPSAFADTNYKAVCVGGSGITSGVPLNGGITATATGSVTFQTVSATAAAAQYTNIECIAVHN